jgi:hypothetical protein
LSKWQKLISGPGVSQRVRDKHRRKLIESSGLFDAEWYLASYPEVADSGFDPLTHFVKIGSLELRSPSAEFNARSYYSTYVDLQMAKVEPVFHFILHGKREGRRYEAHS